MLLKYFPLGLSVFTCPRDTWVDKDEMLFHEHSYEMVFSSPWPVSGVLESPSVSKAE